MLNFNTCTLVASQLPTPPNSDATMRCALSSYQATCTVAAQMLSMGPLANGGAADAAAAAAAAIADASSSSKPTPPRRPRPLRPPPPATDSAPCIEPKAATVDAMMFPLLARRARIALGTATQCTRRND